jgi:hypothetical protein
LAGTPLAASGVGMDVATKTILVVENNELNMKLFHDPLDALAIVFCKRGTGWKHCALPGNTIPT